jgi:hypothetical protein
MARLRKEKSMSQEHSPATLDGSLVTEDPLFYYIHVSAGTVHVQRKRAIRATDNPLQLHEETIILLCKAALEKTDQTGEAARAAQAGGAVSAASLSPDQTTRSETPQNQATIIPEGMWYFSFYCEDRDSVQRVRVGADAPRQFTCGVTGIAKAESAPSAIRQFPAELTPILLLNAALCVENKVEVPQDKRDAIVAKLHRLAKEIQNV